MGSDYGTAKIESWETINGIKVPLGGSGEYLNWEEISEDGTKAQCLTDPYGVLMYSVGGETLNEHRGDYTVFFDFAELPDGRIALDAVWDSESGGTIDGFAYEVVSREEATAAALALCDRALDACEFNEADIGTDPYAFARAVAEHCGGTLPESAAAPPWDELRVSEDEDDEGEPTDKTFEIVFHNANDSYVSDMYGVEKGESVFHAAMEICRRYGWDKNRPGSPEQSDA
jgi:hypothetical protein